MTIANNYLSPLVPQRQPLLSRVEAEPHEPELGVRRLEAEDGGEAAALQQPHRHPLLLLLLPAQLARPPAHQAVLARLGQDEVAEPAAAVNVVAVNVAGGEDGGGPHAGGEGPPAGVRVVGGGQRDGRHQLLGVAPPDLDAVIHPRGHDPRPGEVKVRADDLVPVPLHAAEYCDIVTSLDVPQPQTVIFGGGQKQHGIL